MSPPPCVPSTSSDKLFCSSSTLDGPCFRGLPPWLCGVFSRVDDLAGLARVAESPPVSPPGTTCTSFSSLPRVSRISPTLPTRCMSAPPNSMPFVPVVVRERFPLISFRCFLLVLFRNQMSSVSMGSEQRYSDSRQWANNPFTDDAEPPSPQPASTGADSPPPSMIAPPRRKGKKSAQSSPTKADDAAGGAFLVDLLRLPPTPNPHCMLSSCALAPRY